MATHREEIHVPAAPADVWDAVCDVGALATRLVPGFVTRVEVEPGARIVTFANGATVREPIVTIDAAERRLVWSAARHYNAVLQVFEDEGGARLVWIADFLPDEIAPRIAAAMQAGAAAIRTTFTAAQGQTRTGCVEGVGDSLQE